jgi:hypothetical protein
MKITFVGEPGGDWEGLFIDGKLVREGHSLHWSHVLEALGIEYDSFDADEDWMYEHGSFPDDLKDVKRQEDEK